MDEKERIEREALVCFLELFNKRSNTKYRLLNKRERPDFEIRDKKSGNVMGVEVSHIFHDKKEAMMILGRDDSDIHGIITAHDHIKVLMRVLNMKSEKVKHYPYDKDIILVIRDYSMTFDARFLMDHRLGLKVPASGYKEVWYLGRSRPIEKWDQLIRFK